MKKITVTPAVLLFAALLFAWGCDCAFDAGLDLANTNLCIQAPDGTFFGCAHSDENGHGTFTPASGTDCSNYSICGMVYCPN